MSGRTISLTIGTYREKSSSTETLEAHEYIMVTVPTYLFIHIHT